MVSPDSQNTAPSGAVDAQDLILRVLIGMVSPHSEHSLDPVCCILRSDNQHAEPTQEFLTVVKEMLITGDEQVSPSEYVSRDMIDVFRLSLLQKARKVVDQLGLSFGDEEVLRV